MAYTVSNNYKNVIYSGDSRNKIKILFNNVELQDADRYCEKATIKSRIIPNGAKRFSLNNFISKEVELILHDIDTSTIQDQISISIGTLVGNAYEYVPIGIFNIQDTPTTDKNKTTIKLRDNSVKFDFNYNAKPLIDEQGGSATKLQILQDICTKANVTCNISSFIGSTDSIGIYDNTITARQYIADLAEQAGRIATINRSGELIFVNINSLTTWDIPLSVVEKYEIGKAYKIGKVVYEDAIRKYETASTNYDTLYLDSSNPYISSQSQVNSILQQVNTFAIDSVKTGKILGNPAIDSYDLINVYDDKTQGNPSIFKTLATNDLVYNGVLINTFDTQIGEEERKENVSIVGEATFKKWATTSINNINGEIDIQAGKIDNVEKEINPTKDVIGTTFYLEDSTDAELVNFELEGKTTQETRSGRNLLNNTATNQTFNGITYTKNDDGSITLNGTATSGSYIQISSVFALNGTYTLSGGEALGSNVYMRGLDINDGYAVRFNTYPNNISTATVNSNRFVFYLYVSTGTTLNNAIVYPQLESGSTATSYEQYGAMPSPDYPSELVSVGYNNRCNITNLIGKTYSAGLPYSNCYTIIVDNFDSNNITFHTTSADNQILLSNVIQLKPNTEYTIKFERTSTSTNNQWFIYDYNNGTYSINYRDNNTNTLTKNFTTNSLGQIVLAFGHGSTSIGNTTISNIILTEGSQIHSYIPYGKYGIEIETQNKNIFDGVLENGGFNTYGINGANSTRIRSKNYTKVEENTTYTMKINKNATNKNLQVSISYYDKNDYTTYRLSYLNWSTASALNFTTPNNCKYIRFLIAYTDNANITITDGISDIQIEKGNQATTFEEYKNKTYLYTLNQPLRSIGDTKDLLYIKNNMLYVDRKIGSILLNGGENWLVSNTGTANYIYYAYISNFKPKTTGGYSDYYPYSAIGGSDTNQGIFGVTDYIRIRYGIEQTTQDFKIWLITHNVEFQYILTTPYTEELGKVEIPITYKTITYIDTIDINEPNMNITYVRDTQITNYVEEHISQIVVNEEGITQRVQTIEDSNYDEKINAIELHQTSTDYTINAISQNVTFTEFDEEGNPINSNINSVTTTTGFTFNEEGLNIKKSDTDYNTLIDNTGTYYKDGETIISMTNKDGFLAKDFRLQGQHYYSYNASNPSEPLASENYDFVDERIEIEVDGQPQYAYATFYNGEV